MKYAAIMFDVIESRKYENRYLIQDILMNCVGYLNNCFRDEIEKEVVSSAGDEFQGLFKNFESAFLYIRKLQLLIYPVKVRCGIGYGEIKYNVSEWSSAAIDGEAYYLARDAITAISNERKNSICFNTKAVYDKYLNMLCSTDMQIKSSQSQVARTIELFADILMPIRIVKEDAQFYEYLLNTRKQLIEQERWNKVPVRYRDENILQIDIYRLLELQNEFSAKEEKNKGFIAEDYWSKGMATEIASIMNTTRQNVDRYISLGKIKNSRTIDKSIYELLEEKIW